MSTRTLLDIEASIHKLVSHPNWESNEGYVFLYGQLLKEKNILSQSLHDHSSTQVPIHPVLARRAPELLPPHHDSEEDQNIYIVQFKVYHIDGAKADLSPYRGFRKYVQAECSEIGLKGYVWRIPNVHGVILAKGNRDQLYSLLDFVRRLQQYGFIQTFEEEAPERSVLTETFDIRPSRRRHVETGKYSDQGLDEIVSTSSADNEY